MGEALHAIFTLFRDHKLKMLTVIVFGAFFFVMLFPNDDLGDLASAQISRASGLYIQFEEPDLDILPLPSLSMKNVLIEPPGMASLKAASVQASPAIGKLLGFKLGFDAQTTGIFKGDIDLDYGQAEKAKSGARFDELALHMQSISLAELCSYLNLSVRLLGQVNLDTKLKLDHLFSDQPSGTTKLQIASFSLPGQTIMLPMNEVMVPQQMPSIELGRLVLNAKLNDGVLEIPEMNIGDARKDDLAGKIKGSMGLQVRSGPLGVQPVISNVDLTMDLQVSKGFIKRNDKSILGLIFSSNTPGGPSGGFLANYEVPNPQNPQATRFLFRMKLAQLAPNALPVLSSPEKP